MSLTATTPTPKLPLPLGNPSPPFLPVSLSLGSHWLAFCSD